MIKCFVTTSVLKSRWRLVLVMAAFAEIITKELLGRFGRNSKLTKGRRERPPEGRCQIYTKCSVVNTRTQLS